MHAIGSKEKGRIFQTLLLEVVLHWEVGIDHHPATLPLLDQPFRIAIQNLVVALVWLPVLSQAGWQSCLANRHGVKNRRSHDNDARIRTQHPFPQALDAFLKSLKL